MGGLGLLLTSCGRASESEGPPDAGRAPLVDSSPADGPVTDGSLSPGLAGTLILQIAGTQPAVTYDVLRVGGRAQLGGQLVLQFTGGYVPPRGQRFLLVEADGGITGAFTTLTSPGVPVQAGQDANTFWVTVQ
jgi:hypothetical protein